MPDEKEPIDAKELEKELALAVLGDKWTRVTFEKLSQREKLALRKVVGMEVEEFRKEFGVELRAAASLLLSKLTDAIAMDELKPSEMGYTLAVLADKANQQEGRVATNNAAVNVVVNIGTAEKDDLIKQLLGTQNAAPPINVTPISHEQTDHQKSA